MLLRQPTQPALLRKDDIARACYGLLDRFDPTAATVYKAYHPF
ncbi:MAG TPA: hypothetical protein VJP80_08300 [Candidatus Saccharimonadales bacterium]|nr:hypothetical protein [Candidatus Saccharimonadales bacterium]